MTKPDALTMNALRTLFGVRAANRIYSATGGRVSLVLEDARCRYGDGWDAIRAVQILTERAFRETPAEHIINSPNLASAFLKARLAGIGYELFGAVFLNAQHGVVQYEELFRGTATQTSVYPREVVKRALTLNASALVCVHQHPSGNPEPSRADETLTRALSAALALVDVRLIDHLVIAGDRHVSFAERGLL